MGRKRKSEVLEPATEITAQEAPPEAPPIESAQPPIPGEEVAQEAPPPKEEKPFPKVKRVPTGKKPPVLKEEQRRAVAEKYGNGINEVLNRYAASRGSSLTARDITVFAGFDFEAMQPVFMDTGHAIAYNMADSGGALALAIRQFYEENRAWVGLALVALIAARYGYAVEKSRAIQP